ncbi:MAG TPA: type II secretion system-associated lipoprotein [Spirochaetota bacterium]|nr:type II secretion system-associated lipoprotein [Spirochaetota bacterium]HPF05601.1 type II secretion system-associated lipoprotein [Spirochaetota bacterium]HPJ43565.1 type II secretion system-associated lipoprotein [Spirochaetota bacterium]HPR36527.1 type II secretion system-associated lipoprotein [Spirochaetota bacterium]HRX47026.1 type II secretion system-associated lipoprotein [Spirochaetota bacterium]
MKKIISTVFICILISAGCSTFVPDEEVDRLTVKFQSYDYILLQDVKRNDITLAKGTVVRLTFVAGDEWVKIYAYDKKEELLTSQRQLLIYMFEDEFPDEEFDVARLDAELAKIAVQYGSGTQKK